MEALELAASPRVGYMLNVAGDSNVVPAKAGTHVRLSNMGPRFRGDDYDGQG